MSFITPVLITLGLFTSWHAFIFGKDAMQHRSEWEKESNFTTASIVGFIANFLDTLGIGSFATSTAMYKGLKLVEDRIIPGTLNVANCIPTVLEAFIYMTIIEVEPVTLVSMLTSATLGAYLGAGIVAKLPTKAVQKTMGISLLVVAFLMFAGKMGWFPGGGEAIGLTGVKLVIAVVVNFFLGALMTAGIGLYAPCMALVYFLGMSPAVAFPIMMGSCAFLLPVASIKFVKEKAYNRKVSVAVTLFGAVGVLIAAYIVKSLPLDILKWLVIAVILYTSINMLKDGFAGSDAKEVKSVKASA